MNDNSFSDDNRNNGQFVLSYELLRLLEWLIEHDMPGIKKIIATALQKGLHKELQNSAHMSGEEVADEMQDNIIDFLLAMETILSDVLHEHAVKNVVAKNLMPSIDHIDSTVCDNEMVRSSIEKATTSMQKNPELNPEEALFTELLKQWKPTKQSPLN